MNNLRTLRKQQGLSQEDLGRIVHVTKMTISRWEQSKSDIDIVNLKKLSDYFGVSIDYILGNVDMRQKNDDGQSNITQIKNFPAESHKVPIVGSVACSWDEGFIEDFDGEYTYVNDYLHDKYGENIRATIARGNSMKDMIVPGDLLIVVPASDLQNEDIVIATIGDDELTAKKIHFNNYNGFDLIPVNPKYGTQSFTKDEIKKLPVNIVGRVIEIRKGLRQ